MFVCFVYIICIIIISLSPFSFSCVVTATLVSKANASGDQEELQDAVSQALIVGFWISLVGSLLMMMNPTKVLSSVLKGNYNMHLFPIPSNICLISYVLSDLS